MQQQVAEIDGVEGLQPLLVLLVELGAAVVVGAGLGGGHLLRRPGAVLPAVDQAREHPGGPALVVDVLGADQLLEQAQLVVGVEDGEVRLQPHQLGMAAQQLDADRVEGAQPGHPLDGAADQLADAVLHLARGLVGEGDGEDLVGPGAAGVQQMRDARGQRAGLACARAGEHQHGAVERFDRRALVGIQAVQIGRRAGRHGAGREALILPVTECIRFIRIPAAHDARCSGFGAG